MSRRIIFIPALLLAMFSRVFCWGAQKDDGGAPGAFLDFGASAKSLAMGRAYTAVADDASAAYWNPSGLAQLEQRDLVVAYSALGEDSTFGAFNYSQPTRHLGTFGFSLVSLRSSGFNKRSATGKNEGDADVSETGFLLSQGYELSPRWMIGSTLKMVQQKIDVYSATGLGLDAGLIRKLSPKWQAGLAISNVVAPSLTLKNSAETYERQVRWGLQWAPSSKVTLAADLAKGEEGAAKLSVGTQWAIAPLVALRAGMNQKEITAGLGLNLGSWNLDYAFGLSNGTPGAERLGPSHRFGLHVAFGQTRTELLWLAQNQKYKPLALKTLADLRGKMSNNVHASTADVEALLTTAAETIRYGGFSDLQNLYEAQAYIFYFQKKYNDAMSYLSQALALGGDNAGEMKINYQTILSEMNGEQRQAALAQELKKATDFYKQGEWKKTLESCRKILEIDPEHIEAREYAEDAQVRLNEPIERAMRIAKAKFERGEYLDVIKNLHLVREQNPENQEAVDLMNRTMEALEKTAVLPPHSVTEIARDTEKSREFFSKGLQYYSQGKLQEALVSWKDAVRYDETNLSAQKAYERALLELGDRP